MRALVVYESMWGNTEQVARAIAEGLATVAEVEVCDVTDVTDVSGAAGATAPLASYDLIVAGGPTHAFSMSRPTTREEAHTKGADHGSAAAGLREWLDALPSARDSRIRLATFDTRVEKVRHMPGSAAKAADKVAKRHGFSRAAKPRSFYVADTEGPLLPGELEAAREWGVELATTVVSATSAG